MILDYQSKLIIIMTIHLDFFSFLLPKTAYRIVYNKVFIFAIKPHLNKEIGLGNTHFKIAFNFFNGARHKL